MTFNHVSYQPFDIHAHLVDMDIYDKLIEGKEQLNHNILTAGYSHTSNIKTVKMKNVKNVFLALGIAAQEAIKNKHILDQIDQWIEFIESNKHIINAIGEIGLDYHWTNAYEDIEREKTIFRYLLSLAERMKLPIIVHSRKAEDDVINEILNYDIKEVVLHCFSGNARQALKAVDNNMLISIPPIKSRQRKKVIKKVGIHNLVVETDAPYIGKHTTDINKSIEIIASALEIDNNTVKSITYKNSIKILGIQS